MVASTSTPHAWQQALVRTRRMSSGRISPSSSSGLTLVSVTKNSTRSLGFSISTMLSGILACYNPTSRCFNMFQRFYLVLEGTSLRASREEGSAASSRFGRHHASFDSHNNNFTCLQPPAAACKGKGHITLTVDGPACIVPCVACCALSCKVHVQASQSIGLPGVEQLRD